MGWFETVDADPAREPRRPGRWIDAVRDRRPPKSIMLDMDSCKNPVHGEEEGAASNGHFRSNCLHPSFVFNQFGDPERCALRHGNVHSAEGWEEVLRPALAGCETAAPISGRNGLHNSGAVVRTLAELREAVSG